MPTEPLDLEPMKALEAKATEGPWTIWDIPPATRREDERDIDLEFLSAARTFIPQAIAEIERLRDRMKELAEALDQRYVFRALLKRAMMYMAASDPLHAEIVKALKETE